MYFDDKGFYRQLKDANFRISAGILIQAMMYFIIYYHVSGRWPHVMNLVSLIHLFYPLVGILFLIRIRSCVSDSDATIHEGCLRWGTGLFAWTIPILFFIYTTAYAVITTIGIVSVFVWQNHGLADVSIFMISKYQDMAYIVYVFSWVFILSSFGLMTSGVWNVRTEET